jgi:predicted thioesterase
MKNEAHRSLPPEVVGWHISATMQYFIVCVMHGDKVIGKGLHRRTIIKVAEKIG